MIHKYSKEFLSRVFDELYNAGIELIKKYNPCQIKNGRCVIDKECCCRGCKYLGEDGCSVKALFCKLHICHPLKRKYPELELRLQLLMDKAEEFGLLGFRESKQDTLTRLLLHHKSWNIVDKGKGRLNYF